MPTQTFGVGGVYFKLAAAVYPCFWGVPWLLAWTLPGHAVDYGGSTPKSTVEARKLEYDRPLIPKQKKEGKPAEFTLQLLGAYCRSP